MSHRLAARLCREAARRQARYRRISSVWAALCNADLSASFWALNTAWDAVYAWLPANATAEERILALCFAAAQLEDDDG